MKKMLFGENKLVSYDANWIRIIYPKYIRLILDYLI